MRKCVRVLVPLLLLFSLMAAPASATVYPDQGRTFGVETGYVPGEFIPAGRCPAQAMWMLLTAGTGDLNTYGSFDWTAAHCSWVVGPHPAGVEGALGNGAMVLTFHDSGDELHLAYQGRWRFSGEFGSPDGVAEVRQTFTVAGGTGMFEGATGQGHLDGTYMATDIRFRMLGAIELDD